MRACRHCGRDVEDDFRFCPGCGCAQRLKVVEHFNGDDRLDDGGLRVSIYLTEPQHVRLSIWRGNTVTAAMSLKPAEARRLGEFLARLKETHPDDIRRSLRRSATALKETLSESAHEPTR